MPFEIDIDATISIPQKNIGYILYNFDCKNGYPVRSKSAEGNTMRDELVPGINRGSQKTWSNSCAI